MERAVQRRLEQFNLQGFYVQVDREGEEEENIECQGIPALGKWPWDHPKYDSSKTTLRKWKGTKKFHDLIWDMQKNYEDSVWQLYKERVIGFTYRFQFEKDVDELLEDLQTIIFSKVWNDKREGNCPYVLGAT